MPIIIEELPSSTVTVSNGTTLIASNRYSVSLALLIIASLSTSYCLIAAVWPDGTGYAIASAMLRQGAIRMKQSDTQNLIAQAYKLPFIQTGDYCDPYLDVVHKYLTGEGDICDVQNYLERAINIQALPYSRVR